MFVTSCESPVSLVRSRPRVPCPVPVLAMTVHCVAGAAPTGVTLVMTGDPPSPVFTRVKLLLVRPLIPTSNVATHETELALVGLLPLRLMDWREVSERSIAVQVCGLVPEQAVSAFGDGSVVLRVLKLLPDSVPWFRMRAAPTAEGLFTVTRNFIVTLLPTGNVPIAMGPTVSPDCAGTGTGRNSGFPLPDAVRAKLSPRI